MTRSIKTYTATGRGVFPLDMLRYDQCWPYSQDDVNKMDPEYRDRRNVTLSSYNEPTVARWDSFGWSVKDGTHQS